MKVHYFQRYHQKENVATANTMLLLSRFYSSNPDAFYAFIKSVLFEDRFEPFLQIDLQKGNGTSIPDAIISQASFKIVVETKIDDWFHEDQLENHLKSFGNERNRVLLSIAREPMAENKKRSFDSLLKTYAMETHSEEIIHCNLTFLQLIEQMKEYIDDNDFMMQNIVEDYRDFCWHDGLLPDLNYKNYMRMQLASTTLEYNIANNVYYDDVNRGFSKHTYLGLYKEKSVRAIGKICARILAVEDENGTLQFDCEEGEITEERKTAILEAIKDAERYGYDLHHYKHRYFFVEKFYETDFKKISPRGSMGTRFFNLVNVLGVEKLPDTKEIAELLKSKTWE